MFSGSSVTRRFTQTWSTAAPQWVNTLTLYPAAVDLVEVIEQRRPRQALEDTLADIEGRFDVEGDAGQHPEGAETDDEAVEVVRRLSTP